MYEVVSGLLEIFSAMFQGYCLQYFCGSFLESRMQNRHINGLAATVLYGMLRLGAGILLPKGYGSFVTFIRLAVVMCIISMIALIFYRAIICLHYGIGVGEKDYAIHRTELLFILTPGLAGLMVCTLLRVTIDAAESGTPELLYDRSPSLIIIVPVILLLLLFSIVSGVKLFQDMICWNREKSSRIILENQVSSLQEHMGEMDVEGLRFPEKLFIQSYDIGIILGNALDNAMEACRKLKAKEPDAEAFVRISSFQKRELFFLKVENSFDGRLARKSQEEFPITDKADKKSHGIGLANIKSTAEKYQGTMDFMVKGRVFILSVMMKNERRDDDGFWSDR